MFSPPRMIMSVLRSTMKKNPSGDVGYPDADGFHYEEESIRVPIHNVPGVKPTAAKGAFRGLRVFEIAFENVLSTKHDLAQLAVWNFFIIVIKHFHFVANGQAARTGTTSFVRRIESRAASRFTQTVAFDHRATKSLFELLHNFRRHRRRTAHGEPQPAGLE